MSRKIIFINFIYYAVTFILIGLGRDDPSSSLGYGYLIIVFWIVSAIALFFLLIGKIIHPQSLWDKIGIFTATPVMSIVAVTLFLTLKENVSSEYHFDKNNYRYMQRMVDDNAGGQRVEYYKNINNTWVKDSTWIYLSKTGDTIKKIKYKDGIAETILTHK